MNNDWVKSASARQVIGYVTDLRPVWLWSANGEELIWSNLAARLFRAKSRRKGLKLAAPAVPIKGQVARLIRLGTPGRASLSRLRFLSGSKPVSATCTCTPLLLNDDKIALLVTAVDPVEKDIFAEHGMNPEIVTDLFAKGIEFLILNAKGRIIAGSAQKLETSDMGARPDADDVDNASLSFAAGPNKTKVLLYLPDDADEVEITATVQNDIPAEQPPATTEPEENDSASANEEAEKPNQVSEHRDLTRLFDRLVEEETLFAPLGPEDDEILNQTASAATDDSTGPVASLEEDEHHDDTDGEADDALELDTQEDDPVALWQIVGRGFEAGQASDDDQDDSDEQDDGQDDEDANGAIPPPPAPIDQSSRYNFEELSRILVDRIGGERNTTKASDPETSADSAAPVTPAAGALFNLSDETLVLNRLPLGLLIFQDQNILFANRALIELVGYTDSTSLRDAGLAAIFPSVAESHNAASPVTHLAHRNGDQISVSARLQSITWQGQSAFMLSATEHNAPLSAEASVRGFAQNLANIEGKGFFETTRAGILEGVSGRAAELFGRTPELLIGRPLMVLVGHNAAAPLRDFLEQPAKFAETSRPNLIMQGIDPSLEILLFAEGQAGIITGYFGLVQQIAKASKAASQTSPENHIDPAVLRRLSRGLRRPLNTINGFSELIRSQAFGPLENERYVEYATDIKSAGQEIVDAVSELEEFSQLSSGEYKMAPADFDLGLLLEKCLARIRHQAGNERVLVRSAISERLPHIRADEASLGQAILNLLASAIEQTPPGGQVVLSAQREDDDAIAIHVRDSGPPNDDLAERFVVFRDQRDSDDSGQKPVRSSVGLALTRSLLAVNTCTLSVDQNIGVGTLLSLIIPADLAVDQL